MSDDSELAPAASAFFRTMLYDALVADCARMRRDDVPAHLIAHRMADVFLDQLGHSRVTEDGASLAESVEGAVFQIVAYLDQCEALERELAAFEAPTAPPQPVSPIHIRPSLN